MRVLLGALLACWLDLPAAAEGDALRPDWQRNGTLTARSEAKSAAEPIVTAGPPERAPLMRLKPGRSCGAGEFEVCLDSTGRLSVPGAKRFLPALPGMQPERLTVRRSGVVFGYSF